jgi:hypothetical protein
MMSRGQALVELAVCMPIALLLGLGAAGVVQVADAETGLRAATEAAVSAAARAPSAQAAAAAATARFRDVAAAYPIRNASVAFADGGFARGGVVTAMGTGDVDLTWESMSFLPAAVHLRVTASAEPEPWRSR